VTARRVLVATDGSDLAMDAARRGVELLGGDGASVTVLTVVPSTSLIASGAGAPLGGMPADPDLLGRERTALDDQAKAAVDATVAVLSGSATRRVEHGDPGTVICEVAAEKGVDAVVVGSHGSGFLKRVLLGSVRHHVLHHAPCPVLVVRRGNPNR
jgi:nucleotide-binding universal stress UspA family protein